MRTYLLIIVCLSYTCADILADDYPKMLTAYKGTSPTIDGYISEGEYTDANELSYKDGGWQVICSTLKSTLGGIGSNGLKRIL